MTMTSENVGAGLTGEWVFTYGGQTRKVAMDTSRIAVRATPETAEALRTATPRAPVVDSRDLRVLVRELVHEARGPSDLDDELIYFLDRSMGLYPKEHGVWPLELLPLDRLADLFRRSMPSRSSSQTRVEQLLAQLESYSAPPPEGALRGALPGSWVRVPSRLVLHNETLLRTSGAIALPLVDGERLLSDRVFLRFAEDLSRERQDKILREHGMVPVARLSFVPDGCIAQMVSRKGDTFERLRKLLAEPPSAFKHVEPELYEPIAPRWTPNDPDYNRQWQWGNTGANGGLLGADIRAEAAWDRGRGKGLTVAVIDNGTYIDHPDLKTAIRSGGWFSPSLGATDPFVALTKLNRSQFPVGNHGTFCCGMAAARSNNRRGGVGAAPEATLMAIACAQDQLSTQRTLARAIAFAADPSREGEGGRGADVISCSLGPNGADWLLSSLLDLALEFAATRGRNGLGCPILWAASNGTVDISRDEVVSHPRVLAVGRSNSQDSYDGAAFGAELAFVAPGRDVYNTVGSNRYDTNTGCSYSAPLVAGVAALVLARFPQLTAGQVGDRLKATCDKVGGVAYDAQGHHPEMGFGRINADRATQ